jgi:hypothetical protein
MMNVNGKVVCESTAKYGEASAKAENWEAVNSMSECEEKVPVKKGDTLTLESNYDFEMHPA